MSHAPAEPPQVASLWCSRLAVFALVLIAATLLLHRFFGLPTAVALNLVGAGILLAAIAVLLGVIAGIGVWRTGRSGAARIILGMSLGLAVLALPVTIVLAARSYPTINDLTTDVRDPPAFQALAPLRSGMANPAAYPGEGFAARQAAAYPDLVPLDVNRPAPEVFDLVIDALKRLQMTIVAEQEPTDENPVGRAEAVDRTLILGFYDDIAVRVTPVGDLSDPRARIDLRSSSRYGRSDFGANAQRLRSIMREIVARLEATVPAPGEVPSANKRTLKPGQSADREKGGRRKSPDDGPPGTRRAQERKAPPP
ncbi:MAG: DUF1499 domain-containing protein [Hyphomicrobium sp.]